MLDSIYHMPLKRLKITILASKRRYFAIFYATLFIILRIAKSL